MAEGDIFVDTSDSDADTDDLIAAAKSQPIAKKKEGAKKTGGRLQKKKAIPDADNDDDSDNDSDAAPATKPVSSAADAGGLFDSSSEDEAESRPKKEKKLGKSKASSKPKATPKKGKPGEAGAGKRKLSLKERMEALAKKRQAADNPDSIAVADEPSSPSAEQPKKKRPKGDGSSKSRKKEKGYESGDSYESVNFERTKEDDDFIDAEGEDPEALKELYAEQHFDDERPEGSDSETEGRGKKKKSSKVSRSKGAGLDRISDDDLGEEETANATSALVAAVKRMAKKKKEVKKLSELEDTAKTFLKKMDIAADADDEAIQARRPATKKLAMLPQVLEMLAKKDMVRPLLDFDLLTVTKRWVQPLPNGSLGNVTLRHRIIEAISNLTGESGVNAGDLKRSGFGKVVMTLYMHKSETPHMKKLLKNTIEQWSRPIFQKSGNMKDLERVQATRGMGQNGLVGIARAQSQHSDPSRRASSSPSARGRSEDDLAHIISGASKSANALGNNRVRVPYSKGFQFSVRPTNRQGDVSDKRNLVSSKGQMKEGDKREALHKRMLEKNRPTNKQNQRSANISIEGRAVK